MASESTSEGGKLRNFPGGGGGGADPPSQQALKLLRGASRHNPRGHSYQISQLQTRVKEFDSRDITSGCSFVATLSIAVNGKIGRGAV